MNFDFRRSRLVSLGLAFFGAVQIAGAEEGSKVDVSAQLWSKFSFDMTKNSNHAMGFDVSRAYLGVGYKFDDTWSTKILLDGSRLGLGGPALNLVRNLYVQSSNLWMEGGTFRFGMQPTFFIATVDAATKTRWLAPSLAEETGMNPLDTAGLALWGGFNSNMLRYGLLVNNGVKDISQAANGDNRIGLDLFVALKPLQNFDGPMSKLGIVIQESMEPQSKVAKNGGVGTSSSLNGGPEMANHGFWTTLGAITFEHAFVDAAIEMAFRKNGNKSKEFGYGVTANIKPVDKFSLFARYLSGNDAFKTDIVGTDGNGYNNIIGYKSVFSVGPTYSFASGHVSTGLLYENRWFKTGKNTAHALTWNWAASF